MLDEGKELKTCPKCAEEVRSAAEVCKHCGHRFTSRAWIPFAVVAVIAMVLLGLIWNENRLNDERRQNNICSLAGTC